MADSPAPRVVILQPDGSYKDADGNYTLPDEEYADWARILSRHIEEKLARERAEEVQA